MTALLRAAALLLATRSNWCLPEVQRAAELLWDEYGIQTASMDWEDIGVGYLSVDQRLKAMPGVYVISADGVRMRFPGDPVEAAAQDFVDFVLRYRFHAKKTDFGLNDHWGTSYRAF